MAWHVILCSIAYTDAPNKGIEQACSWASCDIHVSPFSINLYLTFSNVLLVLALNLIVHKSSYCKCSLAWCQARTLLLITIWTHPLQMREYPLQYASTDKNKKSHYNWAKKSRAKNLSRDSYEVIISLCFVVHEGIGLYWITVGSVIYVIQAGHSGMK